MKRIIYVEVNTSTIPRNKKQAYLDSVLQLIKEAKADASENNVPFLVFPSEYVKLKEIVIED